MRRPCGVAPRATRPRAVSLRGPRRALVLLLAPMILGSAACSRPDADARCAEHRVVDASCPFCHPELVASLGECPEHGGAEATCFLCHPMLEPAFRATGDWCDEHARPESQCYLCNPQRDPFRDRAAEPLPAAPVTLERAALALGNGLDATSLRRSRRLPTAHCTKQEMLVRFADADVAAHVGLEYAEAQRSRLTTSIECLVAIEYDRDRYARLASPVDALVERITCEPGDRVARGRTLAVLASRDIAEAKAAYLRSLSELAVIEADRERTAKLRESDLATDRDLMQAEADLQVGRIEVAHTRDELERMGFTPAQVEAIARTGDAGPRLELVAPFDGVIVECDAAPGEALEAAQPVLAVADVAHMWARLEAADTAVRSVHLGQAVTVELDALPGEVFGGRVSWVSTAVDPRTRTLPARAVLENPEGLLRANLFGRARVATHDATPVLTVPQDAVQWEGCCNVVFVRLDDTRFEPRKVTLGASTGARYEVLEGLGDGEVVVTTGSFLLKTELMRGSIGAGCCEVAPGV